MTPPPPRPSTATERQRLIAEYEQSKRSESARHAEADVSAHRRRRMWRSLILTAIVAGSLYLWFFPPSWLQPTPQQTPSPAEQAAGTRFAIFLQARQIDRFRSTTGRLPATLVEAGEPLDGIDYIVINPTTYALQSVRDSSIRYASTDSLSTFLGSSPDLLGKDQQQ